MGSATKFSYQRLQNEGGFEEDAEEETAFRRMRNLSRIKKLNARKRPRIRIAGLKSFIKIRKDGLFSALGIWSRALKRLKDSQIHMGELFAGHYLFTQVSPSPLKSEDKNVMRHPFHVLSSRFSLPKFA